jgi:glycosyltransferase involved in cell wall biosynthesis
MKIIVVHILPVHKYPPTLSILHALNDLGHEVQLITTNITKNTKSFCDNFNINVVNLETKYNNKSNLIIKFIEMFKIKKLTWDSIENEYDDNTLIWVFDNSLKFMKKKLKNKRYIVHFFELYDELKYYKKIPFLKINLKQVCRNALKVIHCEYNRSFIAMAKLRLNRLPVTIPNKPYYNTAIKKNSEITTSVEIQSLMEKLKEKKIILYQGLLTSERPLEEYIKAVETLGDDYAFVVLSGGENIYERLNSKNYYFIPFISPPYHLEITSHAYIGILSYFPTYNEISSPLNALYCAPNKLYEYSMFGIPMIGNNIPGLSTPFEKYNCGITVNGVKEDQIISAIKNIEKNHSRMSVNSKKLYSSVDIKNIISKEVLNDLNFSHI